MGAFAELVRRTPMIDAPALGANVKLKLESLQRTGSFKIRGACLKMDSLTAAERARGVVAASAGNHGQGVALAGRGLGVRVEVCVSTGVPPVKRRAMEGYGAVVIDGGANYDEAEAFARRRAEHTGAVFLSPFDDVEVIRGNGGTLGEEIAEQAPDVATVVTTVGGGGLVGGLAAVLAPRGVRVIGVQPRVNCAMAESLRDGAARLVYAGGPTVAEGCDGAVAESTYQLCKQHGVGVVLVDEEAIRRALAYAWRTLGVQCEPTAAVAIAGLLEGVVPRAESGSTVVVVSGANVEPDVLDAALREFP